MHVPIWRLLQRVTLPWRSGIPTDDTSLAHRQTAIWHNSISYLSAFSRARWPKKHSVNPIGVILYSTGGYRRHDYDSSEFVQKSTSSPRPSASYRKLEKARMRVCVFGYLSNFRFIYFFLLFSPHDFVFTNSLSESCSMIFHTISAPASI